MHVGKIERKMQYGKYVHVHGEKKKKRETYAIYSGSLKTQLY